MIKARYDQNRNVLVIELAGKINAPQMSALCGEVQALLPRLRKGFKLLTDLTEVYEVDPDIKEPTKKLMEFINSQGVTEILRVIPDPSHDIGLGIMSLFHYSKDVQFYTFQSRREAEARL